MRFVLLVCLPCLVFHSGCKSGGQPQSDVVEPRAVSDATEEPGLPKTKVVQLKDGVTMEFVLISDGDFMMGAETQDGEDDEKPQHQVLISKSFYLAKTEVTQAQWLALYRAHGSSSRGDGLPVNNITWELATQYCNLATANLEGTYRLPTEAEWEYACRAGTSTAYSYGDDTVQLQNYAWFEENSQDRIQKVGTRRPNPWGLFDMHGNVAEWCADLYDDTYYDAVSVMDPIGPEEGSYRVIRGGSFYLGSWPCRSAYRAKSKASSRSPMVGLRLLLEI